jgi:hypothetical protein
MGAKLRVVTEAANHFAGFRRIESTGHCYFTKCGVLLVWKRAAPLKPDFQMFTEVRMIYFPPASTAFTGEG